jgi:creatinine amidohydrolase
MKTWIPDERFLPYFTWKQVEALNKERSLVIIPTAAIEQHGHHLPLATDTLLNNYILGHALRKLPKDLPVYAAAPVCYGKSNEHIGFPGTLSLNRNTFMAVLHDLAESLHAGGFKKIVFFNSHGGNHSVIDVMARDLRAEFGLRVFCLFGGGGASGLGEQEAKYGFHAGEVETSLLLAATPELVHTDKYTINYIAKVGDPGVLKPEFAYATYAWLTRDIAPSGVMGDPNPSTAEKGLKWCDEMSTRVAAALTEMHAYENLLKL